MVQFLLAAASSSSRPSACSAFVPPATAAAAAARGAFAYSALRVLSTSASLALARAHEDTCPPPSSSSSRRAFASHIMDSDSAQRWRERITLLTQKEAQAIDEELMGSPGFSVDQLMELAGLSVAQAVDDFLQQSTRSASILLLCGPGNNGGDGLVAARHLLHFGYRPVVVYPKRPARPLYENLVKQCEDLGIEVGFVLPADVDGQFDCVVDALFGFGTTGPLRAPFDQMVQTLTKVVTPIVSVDIPSGWDVESGDVHATGFVPEALVSLTAPKKCAAFFRGRHYLGGRFVPPSIRQQYRLKLPVYPGTSQFVEIEGWDEEGSAKRGASSASKVAAVGQVTTEFVVVWVTAPNAQEASALAEGLVNADLAACVNIVPQVQSVYKWEGKVEKGEEILLMAKTRTSLLEEFAAYVKAHHSYQVPETIAAGIVGGSTSYLQWLRESTKAPGGGGGGREGGK